MLLLSLVTDKETITFVRMTAFITVAILSSVAKLNMQQIVKSCLLKSSVVKNRRGLR